MNLTMIGPEREEQLARRMAKLGIKDTDFEETFVRSGGHGGQNVNKTSTCVMLRHRPTDLRVKCQTTRHQGVNRFLARQFLVDKLEARKRTAQEVERARLEKARRQKRPRSRRAKERMLANKSRRAAKKEARRLPVE